jgi:cytochrome c oxidase accessory protein FixG
MRQNQFIDFDDVGVLESPEEVLSTLTRDGERRWMYPTVSKGYFWKRRLWVSVALIALYILLPIIQINGKPAILLDFMSREFAFFGLIFYPTDTVLLMLFMIGLLVAFVLATALLGRVWCGWGCPQTVYLEYVYRPIERWIEGKEHVRKRRNEGPKTFDWWWRRLAKLGVYLIISLVLAHTFVAYFAGWDDLIVWMQQPPTEQWGFFVMMAFTTGLIMYDFTYFREQMCTIACPYARIQSVLLDKDSLIVGYDYTRGEPRAKRSKKKIEAEEAGLVPQLGDCIDCGACVRTCPTGIDIRDGLQMECIACTQCIDACDPIMDRIGKPRGLIRYASERELEGKKTRIWRPRTIAYVALVGVIVTLFVTSLVTRGPFDVNIARSVGAPFIELPDDRLANRVRFRVRNQTHLPQTFSISLLEPSQGQLNIAGPASVPLSSGQMQRVETFVIFPREVVEDGGRTEATFRIESEEGWSRTYSFPLLGPSE